MSHGEIAMPSKLPSRRIVAVALLILLLAACRGGASSSVGTATTAGSSPDVASSATPAAAASAAPVVSPARTDGATVAIPATPPSATLAAEGGDPVVGQLGTYTWADGGSDAPWLPGAPISVGVGEPLAVVLDPAIGIGSWRARSVPAAATGPAGAVVLGEGDGPPGFDAPSAGTWTVEVSITFPGDLGTASYAWQVDAAP